MHFQINLEMNSDSECELNGRSNSNTRNSGGELDRVVMVSNLAASSSVKPILDEKALAKVAEREKLKLEADEKVRVEVERANSEAKEAECIGAERKGRERVKAEALEVEQSQRTFRKATSIA